MTSFLYVLKRAALFVVIVGALIWLFVPREPVKVETSFDPSVIGEDLDAYLAENEARFDDITPGVEKRIIWAGSPGEKTDWAVVYIHGFSATSEEIRPVPDQVAEHLGANLYFARLRGHGRGSIAMVEPVAGDWLEDTAEALAIGRRIGRDVLVIATSTGGTAVAIAATDPAMMEQVKGVALVSPNFRVRSPTGVIFEWPLARIWGLVLEGAERGLDPQSEGHAKYWTTIYPTTALVPMAALVRHARKLDYSDVTVPAMFLFSDEDAVVSAEATRAVSTRWGGRVTLAPRKMGPNDDPFNHVIAGAILSPEQTDKTVEILKDWIGEL